MSSFFVALLASMPACSEGEVVFSSLGPGFKDVSRTCSADEDCVIVQAGCCNCNNSGKLTAINKDSVPELEAQAVEACAESGCDTAISDDPSCDADEARCIDARCELFQPYSD